MLIEKEKLSFHTVPQMSYTRASSWIEIDGHAIEHNIAQYKAIIGPAMLAPVIKSNAYGHGIEYVAKICNKNDMVDAFCVVSLQEALFLRSIDIKKRLIVVSILDGDLEDAVIQDIDVVVYDIGTALALNAIGKNLNKKVHIHIKVDTGLSRLGLHPNDILTLIEQIHALPFVCISGIFTHLAESECADQTFTTMQSTLFANLLEKIQNMGISIPLKHAACSAATTVNASCIFTMVRVGIGIYGLWPSDDNKHMTLQMHPHFSLKPALTWKTKIIQIKDIPVGGYVGYDRTFQTSRPTRLAVLSVGYWDGYDRRLSNKGKVLINNQLAPIVGKIAMNLCMIDITGLDVDKHHEVILLGNHVGVTADDLANACQTINYEFVTRINPLLPRYMI